jgi:hypothetical protein
VAIFFIFLVVLTGHIENLIYVVKKYNKKNDPTQKKEAIPNHCVILTDIIFTHVSYRFEKERSCWLVIFEDDENWTS